MFGFLLRPRLRTGKPRAKALHNIIEMKGSGPVRLLLRAAGQIRQGRDSKHCCVPPLRLSAEIDMYVGTS